MRNFELFADMARFIGKTVTIFTTSGGLSGSGFTGVLASVDDCVVRLITCIGAPPCCPLGSSCDWDNGCGGNWGWGGGGWNNSWGWGGNWGGNWGRGGGFSGSSLLGSVTEIPIHAIASFTHSAI